MSKLHYIQPSGPSTDSDVVRLGISATTGENLSLVDKWKLVKFGTTTDAYQLVAAGDLFDGAITSVEPATSGGWSIGGINKSDKMTVLADGLQATPGTGTIAAGDYVVAGTVTAKGTALPSYVKVCKATVQPTTAIVSTVATADTAAAVKVALDAVLVTAAAVAAGTLKAWKVVSLGTAGTGAVGTVIVIERIGV